jgi:hypothetical protein
MAPCAVMQVSGPPRTGAARLGGWLGSLLKVLVGLLLGLLLVPALLRQPMWGSKVSPLAPMLHASHQHAQLQKQLWVNGAGNGREQQQEGEVVGVSLAGAHATVVARSPTGSPNDAGKGKGKNGKGKGKTKRSLASTPASVDNGAENELAPTEGAAAAAEVSPEGEAVGETLSCGLAAQGNGQSNSQPSSSSNHSHPSNHSSHTSGVLESGADNAALQQQLLGREPSVESNNSLQSLGAMSPTPGVAGADQSPAGSADMGAGGLAGLALLPRTYIDENGAAVIGKLRVGPAILGYGSAGEHSAGWVGGWVKV